MAEGKAAGRKRLSQRLGSGQLSIERTIAFVRALQQRGCDFVDVSSGGLSPDQKIEIGPGYQVPFSEAIKKATGMTTMRGNRMIAQPAQAEEMIATGQAGRAVALARGFMVAIRIGCGMPPISSALSRLSHPSTSAAAKPKHNIYI